MALVKARSLARDYRIDPARTVAAIQEALELGSEGKPGGLKPRDFSMRDLFEELIHVDGDPCGYRFLKEVVNPAIECDFREAMDAVDSSGFRNITGQLLVRSVLDSFRQPAFVLSAVIPTDPTPFTRGEKIPGMSLPRDPENDHVDGLLVNEAEEYKSLGFSEEFVELPPTRKRGLIIPVTREMIFEDLTGLAVQRAAYVGGILGMRKEKRLADVVIGYTQNYKEKRAGDSVVQTRRTYYSGADTDAPWVNHRDNNELADYTSLDEADDMFLELTDPSTGEPIVISGRMIIHTPRMRSKVLRVLNSTEVRHSTAASTITTIGGNPVRQGLTPVESVFLWSQLKKRFGLSSADAGEYWFYGDAGAAFRYLSNWDITVTQANPNSEAEFRQDIVLQYKASERGEAAVLEPRLMQRHRKVAASSSGS